MLERKRRNTESAVVTGGTGGLGSSAIQAIIDSGLYPRVYSLSRSGEACRDELSGIAAIRADVTDIGSLQGSLGFIQDSGVRLLVHTAATFGAHSLTKPVDDAIWTSLVSDVVTSNIQGTLNVLRTFSGLMSRNVPDEDGIRGTIVVLSSIAGRDGDPGAVSYAMSKSAIDALPQVVGSSLARRGIRIIVLRLGLFDVGMATRLSPAVTSRLSEIPSLPQRRGLASEFGSFMMSLVESKYLNSCVVDFDGGMRF